MSLKSEPKQLTPSAAPPPLRRFLMIAPHFPPCRAVAAKRALCFARNLPDQGWEPAVIALPEEIQRDPALAPLTPEVPMYRRYRGGPIAWLEDKVFTRFGGAQDKGVSVTKPSAASPLTGRALSASRSLSFKGALRELRGLPFDRFTKYIPTLLPGALRFLRAQRCELIYATGGPFSTFILAQLLAKLTGLPLILDLRDPYTVDPIYTGRWSALGLRLAQRIERAQFKRASAVILNTKASQDAYRQAYEGVIPAERFTFIRNHFDPSLYDGQPTPPGAEGPFKIIFFGHLTPIRNSVLFLDALKALIDERDLSPSQLRFYTLGDRTSADTQQVQALGLSAYVEALPWLPFTESRALLGSCDLLLDLTSERHYMRISGKLYDYLAAERPILCLSENEEMRQIFEATQAGRVVSNDISLVTQALGDFYDQKRSGVPFEPNREAVYQMSAGPAAERLAWLLNEATSQR